VRKIISKNTLGIVVAYALLLVFAYVGNVVFKPPTAPLQLYVNISLSVSALITTVGLIYNLRRQRGCKK